MALGDAVKARVAMALPEPDDIEKDPERRLVLAVIIRAIADLNFDPCPKMGRRCPNLTAREFLGLTTGLSRNDLLKPRPWSFIWCCYQLDLDPFYIQQSCKQTYTRFRAFNCKRGVRVRKSC